MRKCILLLVLFFAGCNSTDSGDDSRSLSGVFQHVINGSNGDAIIQFQLGEDKSYTGKTFISLDDGSLDCMLSEGAGKWEISGKYLKMTQKKSRSRDACEDAFSAWEDRPDSNEEIRNVVGDSFELFIEADEDTPAQWVKFTKL